MHDVPTMAWVIGGLGLAYIVVRVWASKAEEKRRALRDERMAQLLAERDQGPPPSALPHSLSAVTSDREPGEGQSAVVKVRCRGCKALNDEGRETCEKCGAPL